MKFHSYILLALTFFTSQVIGQQFSVDEVKLPGNISTYAPSWNGQDLMLVSESKEIGIKTVLDQEENPLARLYSLPVVDGVPGRKVTPLNVGSTAGVHNGPSCVHENLMYVTSNLESNDKAPKKLGIFIVKNGVSEGEMIPFPYNSPDNSYNVAHPAISKDGKWLAFSSDQPGGQGGSDLFICKRENNAWGQPRNMGDQINTAGDEFFPSFGAGNQLCFATNGRKEAADLDIYHAFYDVDHWISPIAYKSPINTEFNDFAMALTSDGENGFFTSDRNGKDELFKLKFEFPVFSGCEENYKPYFCYFIEETKIQPNPDMPFVYEWDFGDGTTARGLAHDHCWPDYGFYELSLNIYDTIAQVQFGKVSELELYIEKVNEPYITAPDTLRTAQLSWFSSRDTDLENFEVADFFWNDGLGNEYRGDSVQFKFDQPGEYNVVLGAWSEPTKEGVREKKCVYKTITVMDEEAIAQLVAEEQLTRDPVPQLMERALPARAPDPTIKEMKYRRLYFVEFAESEEQIPLNDPYFEDVNYQITERYAKKDSLYKYSVGEEEEISNTYKIFRELKAKGYNQAVVKESAEEMYEEQVSNKGFFMPEAKLSKVSRKVDQLEDIQFALNSFTLKDESRYYLDYIVAILNMEPSYRLTVSAYTDNRGSDDVNLELSTRRAQEVQEYLMLRGITIDRLIVNGFGNENPIATNDTEEGRSLNRRVEFEIIMPQ